MPYETVYKLPEYFDGTEKFLKNRDLEKLVKCRLLHFVKAKEFVVIPEYPLLNWPSKKLKSSNVYGPYDCKPKLDIETMHHKDEYIERAIPFEKVPRGFHEVTLVEFGTETAGITLKCLQNSNPKIVSKENIERIMETAKRSSGRLSLWCSNLIEMTKAKGDSYWEMVSGIVDDCLFEFRIEQENKRRHGYPTINLKIFGSRYHPQDLLVKSGLLILEHHFSQYNKDLALRHITSKGFVYNLDLEKIDLHKIENYDNIII